jgi:hypothetical protein
MAAALIQWPVEPQGTVKIIREDNKTYTVEHSDLYRVYSREEGFKTYKAAKREADMFRK